MGHFDHRKRLELAAVDAELASEVAETMQALAAPSRVRILARLRESPCSVSELAGALELELSAVSHQLRLLRHLRFVHGRRNGNRVIYSLHDEHVGDLVAQAIYHVEHTQIATQKQLAAQATRRQAKPVSAPGGRGGTRG